MALRWIALQLAFVLVVAQNVSGATFTGRITKISPDQSSITVASTLQDDEKVFAVNGRDLKVIINKRSAKVAQLAVGDLISVFTTSTGQPTRIYRNDPNPSSTPTGTTVASNEPGTEGSTDNAPWSQFLGPDRKNRSPETGLLKQWPESGPELLWTARGLGEGYSSVSIADGKVFTMGTRADQEAIIALDLKTGSELWAIRNGSVFQDGQGNGPRSTPTWDNGTLYTLGAAGDLTCASDDGQLIWTINILERFSASNIVWGISESPLIDGDKLICTPGGTAATMVALKKSDGSPIWQCRVPQNPKAGYASAIVADLRGRKQYVNFCHSGLFAVDASSGQALWGDDNAANDTANCSSPIELDESIFYASGYGTGGALLDFSGNITKPKLAYKTEKMKNHHGGMVELDGYIYGANDNILTCLNAQTGTPTWQERLSGNGKGAITYADGCLYFRSERGPMYLISANPNAFEQLGQFDQPERSGKNAWARPVVADGKLFLRDQDLLLCYKIAE
ncbi:PQQ-binding-like beta-propeller repeat protein [Rubinisphaera margarita]|uniref:PQQ-binding-like beta-propeller repeat protein n=1 Tax=Rubinisphaera margarita TaxID=2909586 RepID=UPI001EE8C7DF|nr:PQQ-binding-like beta-propeller repeat protein [Rubinisphaera margarita]MCG6156157.1 PQQ-binding-like beta-propeller repeat protein [Rubinisphaera margarita]